MAERKPAKRETPALEWITGAVGALIFLGMLGVLIANGASDPGNPPEIIATVERITQTEGGHVVAFTVRNEGDITAAQVRLVGKAGAEEREITLDFLPPHSERRAGLIFQSDPRAQALIIQADGYMDP